MYNLIFYLYLVDYSFESDKIILKCYFGARQVVYVWNPMTKGLL